ncbi:MULTISPECIES: hypothetical protein [Moorena]|uniref:hypothetical protein n=1 Tax=Moorena TaxID=1155738 RepID=UPI0003005B5D|nr:MULTISPECIES: hypothetical protein [Moorena]NEQ15735.1 hypothetical protein [Moorena sp. SIO3E2]NEP32881.1 hypothetical protein [Moorena sp. SIO3B2]NEP69498.1 hypothetical protein [Moorena sp. SIO3A5]NER88215.1 hypothetical protein [Moorena sp. SIO3A2]NET65366.1 hypothetical protein [Moorena sp. SIO1G6]
MVSGQWSVVSGQPMRYAHATRTAVSLCATRTLREQRSVVSGQPSVVSRQLILLKSTICSVAQALALAFWPFGHATRTATRARLATLCERRCDNP